MTQKNIDTMDIIVSKMVDGKRLSEALKEVYSKRNVIIPYTESILSTSILKLNMSVRAINSLMRAKLQTIADVVNYCESKKITSVKMLGTGAGIELFEAILDYSWDHMTLNERVTFLIDTVERNEQNLLQS